MLSIIGLPLHIPVSVCVTVDMWVYCLTVWLYAKLFLVLMSVPVTTLADISAEFRPRRKDLILAPGQSVSHSGSVGMNQNLSFIPTHRHNQQMRQYIRTVVPSLLMPPS